MKRLLTPRFASLSLLLGLWAGFFSPVAQAATIRASVGALTPEGHKLAIAVIALSLLVSPLWFVGARRAHHLALRGITEADSLFKESYARELFFLKHWGRRAANAGAQAAAAAAAAGSSVIATPERRAPPPPQDFEHDAYHEPFGDIAGPGILPTAPRRDDQR